MPDLNDEIRKLKDEGMSLRRIAAALGVSHVTVLKRWRAMEGNRQVVTGKGRKRLPAITEGNDKQAIGSIPHPSMPCDESKDSGNQVVTQKFPSLSFTEGVNPLETLTEQPMEGKKELSHRMCPEVDDLFAAIKEFLESNEVELYRMQVEPEVYQVKHHEQIIRLYVQREK